MICPSIKLQRESLIELSSLHCNGKEQEEEEPSPTFSPFHFIRLSIYLTFVSLYSEKAEFIKSFGEEN